MKKIYLPAVTAILMLSFFAVSVPAFSASLNGTTSSCCSSSDDQTTTVTVTIVKIDLSAKTITLKDQNGKIYVFTVGSTIDLSKFKVGLSVTATILTTYITDKVTRAIISKMQLIKLQ